MRLLAQVHDQVPGLLGGPLPSGMQSDSEDADAPGGVLHHGQDIGLGAIEQFRGEEIGTPRSPRPGSARNRGHAATVCRAGPILLCQSKTNRPSKTLSQKKKNKKKKKKKKKKNVLIAYLKLLVLLKLEWELLYLLIPLFTISLRFLLAIYNKAQY